MRCNFCCLFSLAVNSTTDNSEGKKNNSRIPRRVPSCSCKYLFTYNHSFCSHYDMTWCPLWKLWSVLLKILNLSFRKFTMSSYSNAKSFPTSKNSVIIEYHYLQMSCIKNFPFTGFHWILRNESKYTWISFHTSLKLLVAIFERIHS